MSELFEALKNMEKSCGSLESEKKKKKSLQD